MPTSKIAPTSPSLSRPPHEMPPEHHKYCTNQQHAPSHRSRRPPRRSAAGLVEIQGGVGQRGAGPRTKRGDRAPYLDNCVRERLESGVLLCYDDAGIYYCLMNLLITLMIEYNSTPITMMSQISRLTDRELFT